MNGILIKFKQTKKYKNEMEKIYQLLTKYWKYKIIIIKMVMQVHKNKIRILYVHAYISLFLYFI